MRYVTLVIAFLTVAVLASVPAQASLIVNGDFEGGAVGFNSDYMLWDGDTNPATANTGMYGALLGNEGTYAVGTDPQFFHSAWASYGDHTTGTGNMMVVNGSGVAGDQVWGQSVVLTSGVDYVFTVHARSTYNTNPAELGFGFSAGDSSLGTLQLGGVSAGWAMFSTTFTAGVETGVGITDLVLDLGGNDFVLDDISLNEVVPEPTSIIVWSLLGALGIAVSWHRRRKA